MRIWLQRIRSAFRTLIGRNDSLPAEFVEAKIGDLREMVHDKVAELDTAIEASRRAEEEHEREAASYRRSTELLRFVLDDGLMELRVRADYIRRRN